MSKMAKLSMANLRRRIPQYYIHFDYAYLVKIAHPGNENNNNNNNNNDNHLNNNSFLIFLIFQRRMPTNPCMIYFPIKK